MEEDCVTQQLCPLVFLDLSTEGRVWLSVKSRMLCVRNQDGSKEVEIMGGCLVDSDFIRALKRSFNSSFLCGLAFWLILIGEELGTRN